MLGNINVLNNKVKRVLRTFSSQWMNFLFRKLSLCGPKIKKTEDEICWNPIQKKIRQCTFFSRINAFFISDDPYYCGLRARVPNFVNGQQQPGQGRIQGKEGGKPNSKSSNSRHSKGNNPSSALSPPPSRSTPNLQNLAQLPGAAPPFWWHSRLYPDSGIGGNYFLLFFNSFMVIY